MSGCSYPTLSLTIPLFNLLIDHIEDIIYKNKNKDKGEGGEDESNGEDESDSSEDENNTEEMEISDEEKIIKSIKKAAKICRKKLLRYYNKTNDTYLIATILDPKLKMDYYRDHEWGEELINEIKTKLVFII